MIARRTQREEQRPMAEVAELAMREGLAVAINHLVTLSAAELQGMATKPRPGRLEDYDGYSNALKAVQATLMEDAMAIGVAWIRQQGIFSK
jgi:hypothetical protein